MMITKRDMKVAFVWINAMILSFHLSEVHARGFCNRPMSNRGMFAGSLSKLHSSSCKQTPKAIVFMMMSCTSPISKCLCQLCSSLGNTNSWHLGLHVHLCYPCLWGVFLVWESVLDVGLSPTRYFSLLISLARSDRNKAQGLTCS